MTITQEVNGITKVIQIVAPVTTEYAHSDTSDRYIHLNTMDIVDSVRDCGWEVVSTAAARVRREDRQGFQKHFVIMRYTKEKLAVGDCEMRMMLINSHDGTSSLQLFVSLHRLLCLNGMTISYGQFGAIRIRHTTDDIRDLTIEGAQKIAALAPAMDANIKTMQMIQLTPEQQAEFARKTVKLVYPDKTEEWIDPNALLQSRRPADEGNSLWLTYNRVQEAVSRGGISVNSSSRFRHTRAIKSVIRDTDVNVALFDLAMDYTK